MINAQEARQRLKRYQEESIPPTEYVQSLLHQAVLAAIEQGVDQVDYKIMNMTSLQVARSMSWLKSLGYRVNRVDEILVISFKE